MENKIDIDLTDDVYLCTVTIKVYKNRQRFEVSGNDDKLNAGWNEIIGALEVAKCNAILAMSNHIRDKSPVITEEKPKRKRKMPNAGE